MNRYADSNPFSKDPGATLTVFVCWSSSAFGSSPELQSPQEPADGDYWYEAVFLNQEEVREIFGTVSGNDPKYEFIPEHFHVTTQFMPEPRHGALYGLPVTVHINGYASGSVRDIQENITSENEGLRVELSASDNGLQALIDSIERNGI